MPRISPTKQQRVEQRGQPVGVPSREDVQRRAAEIALIANRTEVTPDDMARARAELANRDLPPTVSEDMDSTQSRSRDPSDPATDRGHQTPEYVEPDEKQDLEQLAVEGVEEAQHEQMLLGHNPHQRSRPGRIRST